MKVALVNTSDLQGGAAIACYRLAEALHEAQGVEVTMVVKEKSSESDFVISANGNKIKQKLGDFRFALEKLSFLRKESSKEIRFQFSHPTIGQDISKMKAIQDADVIHLHWINKGFLSFSSLESLFSLGKPIVWTHHDMWPFTGGCHYAGDCKHFEEGCGNCFYLKTPKAKDISALTWAKKRKIYKQGKLHVVTCSKWLADIAKTASLYNGIDVRNIPNTIDTKVFFPKPAKKKGKHTILFQSMNINDKRKGLRYFLEAMEIIKSTNPEIAKDIELMIFGKNTASVIDDLSYKANYLGLLSNQKDIAAAYNKSDIFVIPSLADNLPNTIMESMACGVPVVGFDTGGIPEMVDHLKNGYIAPQKDATALAEGILWAISDRQRYEKLSQAAVDKVHSSYEHEKVAGQYIALYQSILS